MGKTMSMCGTQVKERARQQKQIDKASKRFLVRQKREHIKTIPASTDADTAKPLSPESTD